jgi:hypothetical protein
MSSRSRRLPGIITAAFLAALLPGTVLAANATVQVNPTDLGTTWFLGTLGTGSGSFVEGPSLPPAGVGSFEMTTLTDDDKSTLVTNVWTGRPLSDLSALDYWTYRDASSTSPSYVAPSINVAIFTNATGPGTGFATLVFEPLYAYGNDAIHDGVWQDWDAFAPTQTNFAGGWWATRDVGTVCAFTCYADFATLLTNAPAATILSVGVNVGRGPSTFVGAVDALSLTMAGDTTTYDFEPLDADKEACKDGGWQDFHISPPYRNQGDCVSFFASGLRRGLHGAASASADKTAAKATAKTDRTAAKTARIDARITARSTTTATDRSAPSKVDKADRSTSTHGKSADKGKSDKPKGH